MKLSPVAIFRLYTAIPLPGRMPGISRTKMSGGFASPPLSIEVKLCRFAFPRLFVEIPWQRDPVTEKKKTGSSESLQTGFPYPYYIDEDEEEIVVTVTQVEDEDADTDEIEIAARRIVRFPHPTDYRTNLAKTFGTKPRRFPPFLKGAKLFVRFR